MLEKFKLTFYGGVGEVSGTNFLLEGLNKKIIIDAGLSVGCMPDKKIKSSSIPYNSSEIDLIFVSHAHLDHMGKIPILVKEGFKGVIYSSPETKVISELMLLDFLNSKIESKFDEEDIKKTLSLWKTFSYGEKIDLGDNLVVKMYDAGHVLGSSIFEFKHNKKNLVFVNSLGSTFVSGLSGMDKVKNIDYLVLESVYGNKVHDTIGGRKSLLEDFIENTVSRHGTVMIPICSIDKIYVILADIRRLMSNGRIPKVPVFVDSVLAHKAMDIYGKLFGCGLGQCKEINDFMDNFGGLKFIKNDFDINDVTKSEEAKIVIAEEDNSNGERIRKYFEKFVSSPNNSIVLVDYQIKNSLGRKLQEGISTINISGKDIPVVAQIETISGYSAHADHNKLFQFVNDYKSSIKKVFVVVGEPDASEHLAQKFKDYIGVNAKIPQKGNSYELDF